MDPPPSEASAIGTRRAATAAAEPPLEPPRVMAGFQGFIVGPYRRGSVVMHQPYSGVLLRPTGTSPEACIFRTISELSVQTKSFKYGVPKVKGMSFHIVPRF